MKKNSKHIKENFISYSIITIASVLFLFPFFFMISTSFKNVQQIYEFPPRLIPDPFVLDWYVNLFKGSSIFHIYYFNSVYIAVIVSVAACIFGSLAGYSFAKLHFKFKSALFLLLLSSMMISQEAILVPTYIIMAKLGWVNTHLPLIIPSIFGAGGIFGMFLMRQFYLNIPDDLAHAAKIDGCGPLRTYVMIMLPISQNLLATVFLLTFLANWDDLITPLIYLNDKMLFTLPLAISLLNSTNEDWTYQMAAACLATLPVLVVFLFSQRWLVNSITMSGIK